MPIDASRAMTSKIKMICAKVSRERSSANLRFNSSCTVSCSWSLPEPVSTVVHHLFTYPSSNGYTPSLFSFGFLDFRLFDIVGGTSSSSDTGPGGNEMIIAGNLSRYFLSIDLTSRIMVRRHVVSSTICILLFDDAVNAARARD